jgi:hypothetical protein
MSKEKSKYCRYLKSAEDSLKKALLVDNYTNRSFTITTKISKSAKYPVRNPIKIINGANYESDASELNTENVEPMDISPPESSNMELSPKEADIVWLDPAILEKADRLESAEIPELFQLSSKKDMKELGKSEFGKLVRSFIFDNLGSYKRLGPAKFEKFFNDKLKLLYRKKTIFGVERINTFGQSSRT